MHCAILKDSDFEIKINGEEESAESFCQPFDKNRRLGIVTNSEFDAFGATNLILTFVNAFYQLYKASGEDYYAYPDFYTFQKNKTIIDYDMLDIYPAYKNVAVDDSNILQVICDQAINILVVPKSLRNGIDFNRIALESAERNIERSFLYDPSGDIGSDEISIVGKHPDIFRWIKDICTKSQGGVDVWKRIESYQPHLEQSFREIDLNEALGYL